MPPAGQHAPDPEPQRPSTTAKLVDMDEKRIALIKHRCTKQARRRAAGSEPSGEFTEAGFENLLTAAWESQRLSCPKRSTIGAYLLETLEPAWQDYVDFHLHQLGCHFCRANLEDLKRQSAGDEQRTFRRRIMESTVGFLCPR